MHIYEKWQSGTPIGNPENSTVMTLMHFALQSFSINPG